MNTPEQSFKNWAEANEMTPEEQEAHKDAFYTGWYDAANLSTNGGERLLKTYRQAFEAINESSRFSESKSMVGTITLSDGRPALVEIMIQADPDELEEYSGMWDSLISVDTP